jgi:hypothetical protein
MLRAAVDIHRVLGGAPLPPARIRVHTDAPKAVFSYAVRWGHIATTKAEGTGAVFYQILHGTASQFGCGSVPAA